MAQNAAPLSAAFLAVPAAVVLLFAALHDVAARTVPNGAAAAVAVFGVGLRALAGDLLTALAVAALVFLAAAFAWRRGWFGGGDVKLLAAASLLAAPRHLPSLLAAVALAGGVLALLYLALSLVLAAARPARNAGPAGGRAGLALWRRVLAAEGWRIRRRGPLPYASAIAAGALFVLFRG